MRFRKKIILAAAKEKKPPSKDNIFLEGTDSRGTGSGFGVLLSGSND